MYKLYIKQQGDTSYTDAETTETYVMFSDDDVDLIAALNNGDQNLISDILGLEDNESVA